jgi:preprotein translocase subunit SecG
VNHKSQKNETDKNRKSLEIKEALWVLSMACIGLLFVVLLHQSGGIMAEFSRSGDSTIPFSFWILVTVLLFFCVSVFVLLKSSESKDFKFTAMLLTGVVPIVAVLFIVINLINLE